MSTSVSLAQAADLVSLLGTTNTFVFEGEPGIGKSAMLKVIAERTGLQPRYVDCALLDLGDLQMPKVSEESVKFVPNHLFRPDDGAPMVVMLDELGKANKAVMNGLLPMLLEHRVGEYTLPEGSIVFAATNMASDGVGDMMQSHAKNRVSFITIAKPDADQWIEWAINNDIDPAVAAWVKEYPQCLASYRDMDARDTDANPYIFNPRKQQGQFVTPRSLEHASHISKMRDRMTNGLLVSALAGTVGESAARDMQAFLSVSDETPRFVEIVESPEKVAVPENPIACVIMCIGAVMRVDKETMSAWMTYLNRLPKEVQCLFAANIVRSKSSSVAVTNRAFTDWCLANSWTV